MGNNHYYIIVTPFFPDPDHWQGPFVLDQVKAIERTGKFNVIVLKACQFWHKEASYTYDGIKVYPIPSLFMPSYIFNGFGGAINGRNLIKELTRLEIELSEISVIHVHTAAYACYATALKKANSSIKTIIQYHDPDPYQIRLGKFAQWRPNAIYRAKKLISQFEYLDLHLCISQKVEYNLTHFPHPHPDECYDSYKNILQVVKDIPTPQNLNTYVLYNGVDTSQFYPQDGLKNPSIFKIGCVANFLDWKDQMTLIKAIELIVKDRHRNDIQVSFVGSGFTKHNCQKYINESGLEKYFIFEKEVHHKSLAEYYNTLDLFVLPSYFEGFGCVFTEAAACGVPFIGCINQGYSELIPPTDKEKWLIQPHNYEQLAKLIERQYLERNTQVLNKTYDIDILVPEFLEKLASI